MKILVVEDDQTIRNELKIFLNNNGYDVDTLTDFKNAFEYIINNPFDLILMDVNLPGIDGEHLCKEIRKESNVPIIIVTSRNSEMDELLSINYGADDFITKPYNLQILLARIERIIARNNKTSNIIKYNDLTIDLSKSSIYNDTKSCDLSRNEIKILSCLLKNKGTIISRDEIISYLWDNDEFVDDNTLTVNINRLRNKLTEMGYEEMIVTKRGQGYIVL